MRMIILLCQKNTFYKKNDFASLIALEDVLGIHKLQHQTNFATDYYGVVLTDKYGYQHSYTYHLNDEKKCDELILITANLCKNAEIGYTKQQRKHIKENTVELNDFENTDKEVNQDNNINENNIDKKYNDLNKLKELLDNNIITKEEFEEEKKKILK